ncbi:progesterone receptor isoform X1 [Rhinatrema bivittatum]|uniref:progesterone receptor isoform X1 n=1 Tax=Rhinatrema bivittatum TaxID=194408 RepID=UPI00112982DA|nr:progesterone receptor isoform X1 [Rhinatrema bivittatum]
MAEQERAPSSASCSGSEGKPAPPGDHRDRGPEQLFRAVSDLALDRLLYPKPDAYAKEGAGSPLHRGALETALHTFLGAGGQPAAWCHFDAAELPGSALLSDSEKAESPQGSPGGLQPPPPPPAAPTWHQDAGGGRAEAPSRGKAEHAREEPSSAGRGEPQEALGAGRGSPLPLDLDFLRVPFLPLNAAYVASRTRQLLHGGEAQQDEFGHLAPAPFPNACQGVAHYGPGQPYPGPKEEAYPGHAFPAASSSSKIKEETGDDLLPYLAPRASPEQAPRAAESPLDCISYKSAAAALYDPCGPLPGKPLLMLQPEHLPSTSSVTPALYQPINLNGHQQHLNFQTGLKEGYLTHMYPSYANFIRQDTETEQNLAQYSYEVLPQKICLICGDEASGCHYGVLTCGSCKVFFKRAMEGQHNYLCAGRNDCIVDKIRRKNCPACRLRKCCQAGMVLGGRKFKKFSKVKTIHDMDSGVLQPPISIPVDSHALTQRLPINPAQELQFIPQLISILQSIEPEVVYAGYDNSQPDTPNALLTILNRLCERQLLCVVKWSKALPGFRNLHIDDQITLLQYSWMSLMVFAMGWRSYKHVSGQMLYFAPDLILNEQRMKETPFYSLCLSMWQLPQEFVKLQVTHEEFLCMKALLLLNTIPLEGLRNQNHFDEMRANYIRELAKAIGLKHKGVVASSQRFYQLTKLMDSMHELVKQLHLFCLNTFLQSRSLSVEFPEMMSEVIAAQLPKILAGMVKPLIFHKK